VGLARVGGIRRLSVTNIRNPNTGAPGRSRDIAALRSDCVLPADVNQGPPCGPDSPVAKGAPFAFAGVWGPLTGQRGTNANPIVVGGHQLFSFLTTEPNAIVQPIHQNTMPLILTEEILRPLARGRHG
jgi:hypothetical protein